MASIARCAVLALPLFASSANAAYSIASEGMFQKSIALANPIVPARPAGLIVLAPSIAQRTRSSWMLLVFASF